MTQRPRRCRYCSEDADFLIRGWYGFPPDEVGELARKPDMEVPCCTVHRTTAKLRVTSFGHTSQTEVDLTTVWNPNHRPSGDGSK